MGKLTGKVAIVTGGASGLGEATAKLFAQEGAKVVIADVHDVRGAKVVADIREYGGEAAYVHTDVSKSDQVRNLVATAEKMYGKLNIMVANAGILGPGSTKRVEDLPDEEWDQILNINLGGVFRCFKYAAPAIRRAGGGAMTATSSVAAVRRVGDTLGAYSASKAGINLLVQQMAYELAEDNIRVNCVCPGGMETRIGESANRSPSEERERAAQRAATQRGSLGRQSKPAEVAQAHLYLVSDDASFVNGQALIVDGGMTIR
jgi:NAD(P)-dependent dehydrogenase (short-subunit alcohol dehydrogenase family)